MLTAQVRRIVICQTDKVLTQRAITGCSTHETRLPTFGHRWEHIPPWLSSVSAGWLTRACTRQNNPCLEGQCTLSIHRCLHKYTRARAAISSKIRIHSSKKCQILSTCPCHRPRPIGVHLVHLDLNHHLLQGLRAGIRERQTFFWGQYGHRIQKPKGDASAHHCTTKR